MTLDLRGRSQRWTPRQLCVFRYLSDIREGGHLDNNADSSKYVDAEHHGLFMTEVKALMRTWRRFYDSISNVLKSTPAEYYVHAWKDAITPVVQVYSGNKRRHSISEVRFSENIIVIDTPVTEEVTVVQRRRIEDKNEGNGRDKVVESFVNSVNNAFTKLKINN